MRSETKESVKDVKGVMGETSFYSQKGSLEKHIVKALKDNGKVKH